MSGDRHDGIGVASAVRRDRDGLDDAAHDLGLGLGPLAPAPADVGDLHGDGAGIPVPSPGDHDTADRSSGELAVGVVGDGAEVVGRRPSAECRRRCRGLALSGCGRAHGRGTQCGGIALGIGHVSVGVQHADRLGGGRLGGVRGDRYPGEGDKCQAKTQEYEPGMSSRDVGCQ